MEILATLCTICLHFIFCFWPSKTLCFGFQPSRPSSRLSSSCSGRSSLYSSPWAPALLCGACIVMDCIATYNPQYLFLKHCVYCILAQGLGEPPTGKRIRQLCLFNFFKCDKCDHKCDSATDIYGKNKQTSYRTRQNRLDRSASWILYLVDEGRGGRGWQRGAKGG